MKIISVVAISSVVILFFEGVYAQQERHNVVMHIGIHKTGSSLIQTLSRDLREDLKADGYELPWNLVPPINVHLKSGRYILENQVNLAACFMSPDPLLDFFPCVPQLLEAGKNITSRKQSLFLTTEEFDNIHFNFTAFRNDYLQQLPVHNGDNENNNVVSIKVIAVYRRYYDFLRSSHNEVTTNIINKILESGGKVTAQTFGWEEWTIVDFINGAQEDVFTSKMEAIQRYKDALHDKDDIIVMNFHEVRANLAEFFFCEAMKDTKQTCEAVRMNKRDQTGIGSSGINHSKDLVTYFLTYHASKEGLLSLKNSRQARVALRTVEAYYTSMHGLGRSIKMICPPQASLDLLLERSLGYERSFLSKEHFEGPNGAALLRAEFEKLTTTAFCTVDVESELTSPEWQAFFKDLNEKLEQNLIGLRPEEEEVVALKL